MARKKKFLGLNFKLTRKQKKTIKTGVKIAGVLALIGASAKIVEKYRK